MGWSDRSFQPRGMNGLEVGAARFFHGPTDNLGYWFSVHDLGLPLQDLYKKNLPKESDTLVFGEVRRSRRNQLASVFLRWRRWEADSISTVNTAAMTTLSTSATSSSSRITRRR
jgi:hypothetical protein